MAKAKKDETPRVATPEEILELPRSFVRYCGYRFRTEVQGGNPCPEEIEIDETGQYVLTEPIKLYYESFRGFLGWSEFAGKWDVGPEFKHHVIVIRKKSEEQEWLEVVEEAAPVFPGFEDLQE